MVLVAGSTGILGSEICRMLREQGKEVRALVRPSSNPEKLEQLSKWGCTLAYGDLKDPGSLSNACKGVTEVISTVTSMVSRQEGDSVGTVDQDGQINLVRAATEAGANQFVLISFPDTRNYPNPLNDAKRAVEKEMERSGMAYTSILANYFMETWLSPIVGFDYTSDKVVIYGEGNSPVAFVSLVDVAKAAVASVGNPKARNKYIPFGGPQNLSYRQAVEIFERVSGKKFEISAVPSAALQQQLTMVSNPIEGIFTALMLNVADGIPMDCQETFAALGIKPVSVEDYARSVTGS